MPGVTEIDMYHRGMEPHELDLYERAKELAVELTITCMIIEGCNGIKRGDSIIDLLTRTINAKADEIDFMSARGN